MAKRKIIWSVRAKFDLYEILDFYLKRNGTATYSKKLNSEIRKSVKLLAKHSDIGVKTDVLNVRNLIEGNYCIFYEIQPDKIEILTIWGAWQNPSDFELIC